MYSRLNHLIQVYSFTDIPSNAAAVVVASDPVRLDLTLDSPGTVAQIHIEPMSCDDTTHEAMSSGSGRSDLETGIRFYRLFATQSDLSVHEVVIAAYKRSADEDPNLHDDLLMFSKNIFKYKRRTQRTEVIQDDDDFTIPDCINTAKNPTTLFPLQNPQWTKGRGRILLRHGADYRLLHDAITWIGHDHEDSINITDLVNQVRQMLIVDQYTLPFRGTL